MKLYSGPLSLFSRKVEIALAEKDLRFEREMVPFSQSAGYSPKHQAVLAANPKGQVPVLVDGDLVLFDSTVILEYLEDAYPDPSLYPATPAARARCRLLELFADEILLVPIRTLMHRSEPPHPDPARRDAQEDEAARGEVAIRRLYDEMEARLGAASYFCDAFSVADIGLFMSVLFALLGVWIAGIDNNVLVQIGLVVLIGLAAKNAILIVEFARQLEAEGKSPSEAVIEACRLRLRPILMTAFAFILGVLPLVTSSGAGAEMRRALGTAVFSGMIGVTLVGLFLTPVFYVVLRAFVHGRVEKDVTPHQHQPDPAGE